MESTELKNLELIAKGKVRDIYAVDSDRDTLPDDWELANGRDPNIEILIRLSRSLENDLKRENLSSNVLYELQLY